MTESLPLHLIKRDGAVRDFDAEKIVQAVVKAGLATQEFDAARAREIVQTYVLPRLMKHDAARTPTIEWVQDAVEHGLYDAGCFPTLRAYIVYRDHGRRLVMRRRAGSMLKAQSTNIWIDRIGAFMPMPIRATHWAVSY